MAIVCSEALSPTKHPTYSLTTTHREPVVTIRRVSDVDPLTVETRGIPVVKVRGRVSSLLAYKRNPCVTRTGTVVVSFNAQGRPTCVWCHGTRYVRHARGWYAYGVRAAYVPCLYTSTMLVTLGVPWE